MFLSLKDIPANDAAAMLRDPHVDSVPAVGWEPVGVLVRGQRVALHRLTQLHVAGQQRGPHLGQPPFWQVSTHWQPKRTKYLLNFYLIITLHQTRIVDAYDQNKIITCWK